MYWQSSLLSSQASPPVENYSLSLILQCGGYKRDSVTGKRGSTGQKVGTISAGALQRYRFKLFFCINYQIQFWILYRISLCVCNQNLIDKKNVFCPPQKRVDAFYVRLQLRISFFFLKWVIKSPVFYYFWVWQFMQLFLSLCILGSGDVIRIKEKAKEPK